MGGRYSTSNPMAEMYDSRASQSLKLPCRPGSVPDDLGNISYHALKTALARSTTTAISCGYRVAKRRSGYPDMTAWTCSLTASATRLVCELSEHKNEAHSSSAFASGPEARRLVATRNCAPDCRSIETSCPASIFFVRSRRHALKRSNQARSV